MANNKEAVLEKVVAWELKKIKRDMGRRWMEFAKDRGADPIFVPKGFSLDKAEKTFKDFFPTIADALRLEYKKHISADQVIELKSWLSSASIKKIWKGLATAAKPEKQDEIRAWTQKKFNESGPPPAWLEDCFSRFETAWRNAQRKTALKIGFMDTMNRKKAKGAFRKSDLSPELQNEYQARLKRQLKKMGSPMWFAWSEISKEELTGFICFLESKAGRAWEKAFHETYLKAIGLVADHWAKEFGVF